MRSYLQLRQNCYHFRLRTPHDLLGIIPQREIVKSLKTDDLKTAKVSALSYLKGIKQTTTLLRSRIISPAQAHSSLVGLLEWKPKESPSVNSKASQKPDTEAVRLSKVMRTLVSDKEKEWSAKTKMETEGVFKLILDLLGDIPVTSIDRNTVRVFRDKLQKLPPNVYNVNRH